MPFGDGTGPTGLGPMSGRGGGYCTGSGVPGSTNPPVGRGVGGRGRGGRGWRNWFRATGLTGVQSAFGWSAAGAPQTQSFEAPTRDQELGALKDQATQIEGALGNIRKRIEALETKP